MPHQETSEVLPAGIMGLVARRTSCRAYQTVPVAETEIYAVLEAARLAPSACNRQPWRFAVVRDDAARQRIVGDGFLPGINMAWARRAPVLIVLGMETTFVTHRLGAAVSGVKYPWVDLGIAGEHLVLAATERGLGTCWIGWIRPRVIRRIVGWPRAIKPSAVISLGYPEPGVAPVPPTARRKALHELTTWK